MMCGNCTLKMANYATCLQHATATCNVQQSLLNPCHPQTHTHTHTVAQSLFQLLNLDITGNTHQNLHQAKKTLTDFDY